MSGLRAVMTQVAQAPDHRIDLTIGNPAPLSEVSDFWRHLFARQTEPARFGVAAGRYGISQGAPSFVAAIVEYFRKRYDWPISEKNVVVGAGAQGLIFSAASLFVQPDNGERSRLLLASQPEYAGYYNILSRNRIDAQACCVKSGERTNAFTYESDCVIPSTSTGMILVSNPANPTGRALSTREFDFLLEVATDRHIPLVVDNAYGAPFPNVCGSGCDPVWHSNVINVFSMSKAGIPGARIAFAIGAPAYIEMLTSFIANSAIHAPLMPQFVAGEAIQSGGLDFLSESVIRPFYAKRRKHVEDVLNHEFGQRFPWSLHQADGGMFCWLWVDAPLFDDLQLFEAMKDQLIFVMPGRYFFLDGEGDADHGRQCFRLSITGDLASIEKWHRIDVADDPGDCRVTPTAFTQP